MLQARLLKKNHFTLYDSFQRKEVDVNQRHPKVPNGAVNILAHTTNAVYLQIVPMLVTYSEGKMKKTDDALLDTGRKSTLIRNDCCLTRVAG